MSNKRVQVSADAGSTWLTLPGSQGEFKAELNETNDTVFGQSFDSQQPNLGQWNVTSNGIFKGVAGYNLLIKKGGTPTAMTAEAAALVSGKIYQITNTAKRVISYLDTLTVLDNAVDHTADVISVDYLTGTVTFAPAYTPTTPITITGTYIPLTVIAKARSASLTMTQTQIDTSDYATAQANAGWRTFDPGLRTANLELGSIYAATTAWFTTLTGRGIVYVEGDLDASNTGKTIFRGFFKVGSQGQSGNQGDVEAETISLMLWVPDGSLVAFPFSWYIATASTLSPAIKAILTAWQNQSALKVRYMPTGVADAASGKVGDCIVLETSLKNAIDGLNEYTFNLRGTGAPAVV